MKKIMFNDKYGLTDAVLQGRKTMTRRIVTDYEFNRWDGRQIMLGYDPESNTQEYGLLSDDGSGEVVRKRLLKYPYRCGEVLAVAQSYKSVFEESLNYAIPRYHWLDDHIDEKGYTNKMFVKAGEMPHQIRITDINIERLQDISDEDCLREGVLKCKIQPFDTIEIKYQVPKTTIYKNTPRGAFAALIDKVSGKDTWESNPYVFTYSFELVQKGGQQ